MRVTTQTTIYRKPQITGFCCRWKNITICLTTCSINLHLFAASLTVWTPLVLIVCHYTLPMYCSFPISICQKCLPSIEQQVKKKVFNEKKNVSRVTNNVYTNRDESLLFYFSTAENPTEFNLLHAKYPHVSWNQW